MTADRSYILIAYLAQKLNITPEELSKVIIHTKQYRASVDFWNATIKIAINNTNNVRKKIEGK